MFSSPASVVGEPSGYDFEKEENAAKWKGVFVNSLRKVCKRVLKCKNNRTVLTVLYSLIEFYSNMSKFEEIPTQ